MEQNYNNEETYFETKEELFNETDSNLPTNNRFLITAEKIRHIIKSAVESLWKKTYTLKEDDISTTVYIKERSGTVVSPTTLSGGRYMINIPKCDVLNMGELRTDSSAYLGRINMSNVENGHLLTILGKYSIKGLQNGTPGISNWNSDATIVSIRQYSDYSGFPYLFYLDSDATAELNNESNLGWPVAYGDFYTESDRKKYTYPLRLIYWDGYWYPINIY